MSPVHERRESTERIDTRTVPMLMWLRGTGVLMWLRGSRRVVRPLRLFRRNPKPPPTKEEIDDCLRRMQLAAHEFESRTFEVPGVPADKMTWYDAETTYFYLLAEAQDLMERLPDDLPERTVLVEGQRALATAFETLPP